MLWPDEEAAGRVRGIWEAMAARELPSLAVWTHKLHQPHCSLTVAEDLPVAPVLDVVGRVPAEPIPLLIVAAGVFPPGALFLAVVGNEPLLAEQRRVHAAAAAYTVEPWPHFDRDQWTPHITLAMRLSPEEVAAALPLVLDHLPITGWFDHGGIEDGTSGESWPIPAGRAG